ncbi:MAG: chaperone modulator CbpM [Hyphomicrobiaceae bacterium]
MITEKELIQRVEGLEVVHLRRWVERGWIVPARRGEELAFDDHDALRAQLICDLAHDVAIEEESLTVVLSLLDQLHGTRRLLKAMAGAIEKQEPGIRSAIVEEIKASGLVLELGATGSGSDKPSRD